MRRLFFILGLLICGLVAGNSRAETFKLNNGESITGEMLAAAATDQGAQIKIGEGEYKRVPWSSFSQEDLKNFAKNQKLEPFVEPFIEITQAEKLKKTEVKIKAPPKLERPAKQSLFGAMFSSSVGLFVLVMLYAAGIYAGYEVAIFRAQPPLLVAGLSAIPVLGFLVPIIFLSLPTRLRAGEEALPVAAAAPAEAAPAVEGAPAGTEINPMLVEGAAHPSALKLHTEAPAEKPQAVQPVIFQRGQFTFNRRFIETKFAGFFGVVRRDAERDQVMVIKAARGQYTTQRITRIAANDFHIQVQHGHASEEIMIPFQEIQEIQLKPKEA